MAKAKAKKTVAAKKGAARKSSPARAVPRPKPKPAKKTAPKSRGARPSPAAKKPAPQRGRSGGGKAQATKRVAVKKPAATKSAKSAKPVAHPALKKPSPARSAAPAQKPIARAAAAARRVVQTVVKATTKVASKTSMKTAAKVAVAAATVPAAAKAAGAIAARVDEKKRTRRPRTRVISDGPAVANWFAQEKARPSSFIPAPPRAEAPSLVAAPPASSDRLIRPEDLNQLAVRTVPVRIDVEQGGGRVFVGVNPQEIVLRPGEGIEWDFRYLGGADVTVDEIVIEFERPSPFGSTTFRSRKPGSARPHRQLSGGASTAAVGKRVQYTVRAMSAFKTEIGAAKPVVTIVAS